jgi:hypothetical protein
VRAVPTSNVALGFDTSRAKAVIRVNGVSEAPLGPTTWPHHLALITPNRKSIEGAGLLVAGGALVFVWRFGPRRKRRGTDIRYSIRRRLGLRSKHSLRGHVGRGRGCVCESSCRSVILALWQTGTLAGDYRRRPGLQRCIRNEQQCNQRQTYHRQKG